MTADLLRENARLGEMVIHTYAELHLMWQQGRTEIARLQAELDAARKERDEIKEMCGALAEHRLAKSDGYTIIDFLRLWWQQEQSRANKLTYELAALRTRLESDAKDAARYRLARTLGFGIADWQQYAKPMIMTLESADERLDAAINTAATQGGANG